MKQLDFKAIPKVSYKDDPEGTLSMILPKVVMIHNIWKCCNWKVWRIRDLELKKAYHRLCKNEKLKDVY